MKPRTKKTTPRRREKGDAVFLSLGDTPELRDSLDRLSEGSGIPKATLCKSLLAIGLRQVEADPGVLLTARGVGHG